MKDVVNLAVVNFNAYWGNKEKNFNRIISYVESAAKRGAEMIVFPELALTGYDNDQKIEKKEKMQVKLAESRYGELVSEIALIAKNYHMFILFGMPEKDSRDDLRIYNTVIVATPEAKIYSYRKMHLALDEPNWATAGDEPLLFETPWGLIGVAICYDVYSFPELIRYYAAKGARLIINPTAYAKSRGFVKGKTTLESAVLMNGVYIATANLCGQDLNNYFWGGSSIIGPSRKMQEVHYYAGKAFGDEDADEQEMYMATIDLSLATRGIFEENNKIGRPDFRPDLYEKLYKELSLPEEQNQ